MKEKVIVRRGLPEVVASEADLVEAAKRIEEEPPVADESVASDLRDIHRPGLDRRASGFCDG